MHPRMSICMALFLALLLSPSGLRGDDENGVSGVNQEWKKLNGSWSIVSIELGGKSLMNSASTGARVQVKDGAVTVTMNGVQPKKLAFAIDITKDPKTATATFNEDGLVLSLVGIYEISGNDLKFVFDAVRADIAERKRPKSFDSGEAFIMKLKKGGR